MKSLIHVLERVISLMCVGVAFPLLVDASDSGRFVIQPEGELGLKGRATLRSWRFESRQVLGSVELEASLEEINGLIDRVDTMLRKRPRVTKRDANLSMCGPLQIQVSVPVGSLTSGNPGMTRDMYKALKKNQFPMIRYEFTRLVGIPVPQKTDTLVTRFKLKVEGTLEIAGKKKSILMDVMVERHKNDRFKIFGKKRVKMTDFGITPPSAFFGLIRAHDQVDIIFDLALDWIPQRGKVGNAATASRTTS